MKLMRRLDGVVVEVKDKDIEKYLEKGWLMVEERLNVFDNHDYLIDDNIKESMLMVLQIALTITIPILFYILVFNMFPTILSPYFAIASLSYFLYRDNKYLNAFILTSLIPMVVASFSFIDGTLSLIEPIFIFQFILHLIPIVVSFIIMYEHKDIDFLSFILLTILTFAMYGITLFIGEYTVYHFSNIYVGIFVWIVNFFFIFTYLGLGGLNEDE